MLAIHQTDPFSGNTANSATAFFKANGMLPHSLATLEGE